VKFTDYPLAPEIKRSIGKLGWKRPTDIQYKAIPNILRGEDVMGIAQTGTGKTAAFAIPVVQLIHTGKENARRKDGIKWRRHPHRHPRPDVRPTEPKGPAP